ncbi:transposase [Patescibacteria group bacterium]|nr:transposase [Patescibacteria group bacterium]
MTMRKIPFANGEYYHIYNRGVDKRNIFKDIHDRNRFFQSMKAFNRIKPIQSLRDLNKQKEAQHPQSHNNKGKNRGETPVFADAKPLVVFVCYCLNPNHYHFVLRQLVDGGISEFMKRMGGYTSYFNKKYKRSGVLFQSVFKSNHIDSNEYLLHVSTYVNLNNRVHSLGGFTPKLLSKSSWAEYVNNKRDTQDVFCEKDIILGQFKNVLEYKKFAESSLKDIQENKEMAKLLLE